MDLDLNILEEAANLAMEEQLSTDEITDRVQNLNMVPDEVLICGIMYMAK